LNELLDPVNESTLNPTASRQECEHKPSCASRRLSTKQRESGPRTAGAYERNAETPIGPFGEKLHVITSANSKTAGALRKLTRSTLQESEGTRGALSQLSLGGFWGL